MRFKSGYDSFFSFPASQGDPDYSKFWDSYQKEPEVYSYQDFGEAIKSMREERVVSQVLESHLAYYFLEHPLEQNLKLFDRGRPNDNGFIITKDSPLGPILKFALTKMVEEGIAQREANKFVGPEIERSSTGTMVLSAGQVILIYVVTGILMVLSVTILLFEHLAKKGKNLWETLKIKLEKSRRERVRESTRESKKSTP